MLSRIVVDCAAAARIQRVGAICASLALLAFTAGAFVPGDLRTPWLVATLIGFRLAYSLFDVPQNAYLSLASAEASARAALSSVRFTASGAATLTIGLAFAAIAVARGEPAGRTLFLGLAAFTAVVTIIGAFRVLAYPAPSEPRPPGAISPDLDVPRLKPYLGLLVAISAVTMASEFFFKFEAHFAALAVPGRISPWLLVAAAAGQISSQPLWRRVAARGGEERLLASASVAWGSCALLAFLAPIQGPFLLLGGFLYSASLSGVAVAVWMILARVSVPPANTTRRFGAFTFVAKMTEAATMPFLGLLLERAFYAGHQWQTRDIWLVMLLPASVAGLAMLALLAGPIARTRTV